MVRPHYSEQWLKDYQQVAAKHGRVGGSTVGTHMQRSGGLPAVKTSDRGTPRRLGQPMIRRTNAAGSNPAPSPKYQGFDSKLECSRWTYLSYLKLAGDIKRVVYHPFKVRLAESRWYEPDNLIEWKDGRLQVEEVKGSVKMKNARDSITRLHVAASLLPMFDWRLTLCVKGQWDERRIR